MGCCNHRRLSHFVPAPQDILRKEDGMYIKYAVGSMLSMRYQVGGQRAPARRARKGWLPRVGCRAAWRTCSFGPGA